MEKPKLKVEVQGTHQGAAVRLSRDIEEGEDVQNIIRELSAHLAPLRREVTKAASVTESIVLSEEIAPMPELTDEITELPKLENAPHSYKPVDATAEILNPNKSRWAAIPRPVREIQEQLVRLGVRGVTNVQNFDATIRGMVGSGKLKREKIDGVYKYYKG